MGLVEQIKGVVTATFWLRRSTRFLGLSGYQINAARCRKYEKIQNKITKMKTLEYETVRYLVHHKINLHIKTGQQKASSP